MPGGASRWEKGEGSPPEEEFEREKVLGSCVG
jgi:hypothetical protein